jgi:hypothetical protein
VYGSSQYQGLGIAESQGIADIERILKYSQIYDDITGQLIQASTERLKLEISCNGQILPLPYANLLG